MMHIILDYAKQCQGEYSLFVTFSYRPDYVTFVKSIPGRKYDDATKTWEIPYNQYTEFISLLNNNNVLYTAEELIKSINIIKENIDKINQIKEKEKLINSSTVLSGFKTTPFDYQLEGIKYGLDTNNFLLGDQPGLGKSLMSSNIARLKRGGQHCLVICGYKSLLFNWVNEIQKHTNETGYVLGQRKTKRTDNLITGSIAARIEDIKNIEKIKDFFIITDVITLRQSTKKTYIKKTGKEGVVKTYYIADMLENLCRTGVIGRIIFDEAHVCCNIDSDQTQALLRLKSCLYKIAMTGTPIMNRNIDLFPIMSWLGYEKRNYWEFSEHFCKFGGFKNKEIVGNKNNEELHNILSKFMLRRLKTDVLDLPEKIIIDEYLDMEDSQRALYEKMNRLIKGELTRMKGNKNKLLESLMTLRKITCHPGWVDPKYKDSVKYERAKQIIKEAAENNEKTIIVSSWTTPFESTIECVNLKKDLEIYNPAMITGGTKDRQAEITKFQTDPTCKVFIGSIKAMGVGITLNAASNIIYLDEPWNKSVKDQCTDRAHRVGTKNNVKVYTLICRNTKDEGVHATVYKKGRLADEIVDGITPEELETIIKDY